MNRGFNDPPASVIARIQREHDKLHEHKHKYHAMVVNAYGKYNGSEMARQLGVSRQALQNFVLRGYRQDAPPLS